MLIWIPIRLNGWDQMGEGFPVLEERRHVAVSLHEEDAGSRLHHPVVVSAPLFGNGYSLLGCCGAGLLEHTE